MGTPLLQQNLGKAVRRKAVIPLRQVYPPKIRYETTR